MRQTFLAVSAVLFAASLQTTQVDEVRTQAQHLLQQFRDSGRPHDHSAILELFAAQDDALARTPAYLLLKARYLDLFDESPRAAAAFDAVPEEALDQPADLYRRLQSKYQRDPQTALEIARRLAGRGDDESQSLFVHWVHDEVARAVVPRKPDGNRSLDALLDGLSERTDILGFTVSTTAALRWYCDVQTTTDPDRLYQHAQSMFSDPQSYGPRYRLLVADVLDQRKELPLRAEAHAIRVPLIKAIQEHVQGRRAPEMDHDRGIVEYWRAYAESREAAANRWDLADPRLTFTPADRINLSALASGEEANAATAMINGHRPALSQWPSEALMLGGKNDFLTNHVGALEQLARSAEGRGEGLQAQMLRKQALGDLIELTRIDGAAVEDVEARAPRLDPSAPWHELWIEGLLRYRDRFPATTLMSAKDGTAIELPRGRWFMLAAWNPECRECESEIARLDALAHELGPVYVVTTERVASRAARYLEVRGLQLPVGTAPPDVARALEWSPAFTVRYMVAPDGRFFRLPRNGWQEVARRLFALSRDRRQ